MSSVDETSGAHATRRTPSIFHPTSVWPFESEPTEPDRTDRVADCRSPVDRFFDGQTARRMRAGGGTFDGRTGGRQAKRLQEDDNGHVSTELASSLSARTSRRRRVMTGHRAGVRMDRRTELTGSGTTESSEG